MSDTITIEDIENETGVTPDIVAARSRAYTFKGKPLYPFSKQRASAARFLGNYFFLGRAKVDERGMWPEISFDTQMVLWLCSVDDTRVVRCYLDKDKALMEMAQWWDTEGGMPGSSIEDEAGTIFGSILQDIQTVSATAEAPSGGRDTSNLGE